MSAHSRAGLFRATRSRRPWYDDTVMGRRRRAQRRREWARRAWLVFLVLGMVALLVYGATPPGESGFPVPPGVERAR